MKPRAPASHGRQAAVVLLASVAVTLAMFVLPGAERAGWLLAPFRWLHIYVHELGHGIGALISGGVFRDLELYTYSGVAHVGSTSALGHGVSLIGGLCGPALVGGVFLAVGRSERGARLALAAFGAFMAVALVLWTRTPFGWGFGGALAAISLGIALKARPAIAQWVLVFLAVQLALSTYTGGGYLFIKEARIQSGYVGPSDTQQLAETLGMTYWFWGAVCAAFSVAVLLLGLWRYIRPGRSAAGRAGRSTSLVAP